ncbi:MAG: amidase [Ktedonobacteraceae bacterium]|nr:amidase [Ktedonobacteraceae bacterium]
MELTQLTLAEAAKLIEQRHISPVELTEAYLARIEHINPRLNCFITLTAEAALEQAKTAGDAIGRGEYRGALHGIPVALKDVFETRAVRTTAGSRILAEYVPEIDCAVVQRLNTAGAILLGKLNMYEWAMKASNDNPYFGTCYNPWDLARSPGGSSGGAGAALAADLCCGALGSDSGGSTRIPAAFCGVVALKPTYGRVSKQGVIPLSWSLDHVGVMARRVRDVALLFQAIAGYDAGDPYSINMPTDNYLASLDEGIRGWRIAVAYETFFSGYKKNNDEVVQAIEQAIATCRHLGASIRNIELPRANEAGYMNSLILTSEAAAYHHQRIQEQPQDFGADTLDSLESGAAFSALDYALARREQVLFRHQLERLLADHDLLLTPTTPDAAPLYDEPDDSKVLRPSATSYTSPFNLAGLPALSLPCGFTRAGLPIGLQLVARPWAEAVLLRAGQAYEQATGWHLRRPAL